MARGIFEVLHVPRGRRCPHPGCATAVVPLETMKCDGCGRPLPVVWGWSLAAKAAAAGGLLLTIVLLIWAFSDWSARRAEERRVAEAAQLPDELPAELTPEIARSLEALLRDLYRDLRLDPAESARLRAFAEEHRLAAADVATAEGALQDRLKPAAEHLRRGRSAVERRSFVAAEQEYRLAIEADPGDPLAWAQLGAALAILGRSDEALAAYRRALDVDPSNWLAHYNLAVLYARRDDALAALASIDQAISAASAEERRAVVQALLEEPALSDLRGDPRFGDLVAAASHDPEGGAR